MNKRGPIVIIEDDKDDQEIFSIVFEELEYKNELIFFTEAEEALEFLKQTTVEPFLILSDINMPRLNGIELRDKMLNSDDLILKSIPFIYFSTSAEHKTVVDAYSRSIQGFFVKPDRLEKLKRVIIKIVDYWQECVSPGYVKNEQ